MHQFLKSTSTYFSLSCINLVTIETVIDLMQLLGQLCRLPCRHLSKSVFVHRLVSFMNGDNICVGFIPDIYKPLDKYQLVGYILTFLNDALFPSKPVWRAILRQHVTDNETGVDAQRERMVVTQCCRYKQSIQLVEYM